ncbi:unnamed protein product [Boreogadus saida]
MRGKATWLAAGLLQLRENLEASSCHLEDSVRAKFDEVEHLISQIGLHCGQASRPIEIGSQASRPSFLL